MEFLEENNDFIDFEEPDIYTCHECGAAFEVYEDEAPDRCPICGVEFVKE